MKKTFLLFLMALLCCVTGTWAQAVEPTSGKGTQEEPFIYEVSDGSVVNLATGTYGEFHFTPSEAGTLTVKSSGYDTDFLQSFKYRDLAQTEWTEAEYDGITGNITMSLTEAAMMYVIQASASYEDNDLTFTFSGNSGQGGDQPGGDQGTSEDNPYIATANESLEINVPMFGKSYVKFTAPENGTLKMVRETGFASPGSVTIKKADGTGSEVTADFGGFADPSYTFDLTLEAGVDYIITITGSASEVSSQYLFEFEKAGEVDPNAFRIISPAEETIIEEVTLKNPITVTVNRLKEDIPYMRGFLSDYEFDTVEAIFVSEDTDAGTSTWTIKPTELDRENTWVLYDDKTYTLTLEVYESAEGAGQALQPTEVAEVTIKGGTPAIVYSDISLIKITPYGDDLLSSDGVKVVTVEFDGKVKLNDFSISLGQSGFGGGGVDVGGTVEYTEEGHTIITSDEIEMKNTDAVFTFNLDVVDEEGNRLKGNTTVSDVTVAEGVYSFTVGCKDGRWVNKILETTDLKPMDNSYVEELGKVTFTMTGGMLDSGNDPTYGLTTAANAGIYNGEEKVYDVVLSQDDERAASEFESEDLEFGGTTEYVPGTTAYFIATVYPLGTVTDNVAADGTEPVAITTPGVYTLKIDEQSIGDSQFDIAYPWMGPIGSTDRGRCNPEYNWTFNVVEKVVEVESVDPVPYNVSGEYNEEVPAEVTVKFNDADVNVEQVMIRYGQRNFEFVEFYDVKDGVLTFDVPEKLLAERAITVLMTATASTGQPINYGYTDEELNDGISGIQLIYQTPQDVLVPTEVTPADKAEVKNLSDIVLSFGTEELGTIMPNDIELRDAEDQLVTTGTAELNVIQESMTATSLTIMLETEVTEAGTYTLVIPAETFYNATETLWNPELKYTFTVNPTLTGISGINVDANETVKVYTIGGVYVGEGQAAEILGKLAKGIYIVNGAKVAIK